MSDNAFRPASLVLATVGLSLATFMQVLDTTIANVALTTISGNLGVSSEQGTWVITAFAVSNAIALPLTGWMARRFGEVKLFMAAVVLFVITSFLCGIATSMPELVIFRAMQGFVAGPLYPMAQTLLLAIFPAAKRGMALALNTGGVKTNENSARLDTPRNCFGRWAGSRTLRSPFPSFRSSPER